MPVPPIPVTGRCRHRSRTVNGRPVAAFSHDQSVMGGTVGEMFGRKVAALMEWSGKMGAPLVGINDSAGARIQDAIVRWPGMPRWASRVAPFRTGTAGVGHLGQSVPEARSTARRTPTSLVGVEDQSYMFVTGPDVIKATTGGEISAEDLGSAHNQARWGNIHHHRARREGVRLGARYLDYMPSTAHEKPPVVNPGWSLRSLIPTRRWTPSCLTATTPDLRHA